MKKQELIDKTNKLLKQFGVMTVRQIFYQLVVSQTLRNKRSQYVYLDKILVLARKSGAIPWTMIADKTRDLVGVESWDSVEDFIEEQQDKYRREVWNDMPTYIEVWLEKQALSSQFWDVLEGYRMNLMVTKGYPSYTAIAEAESRFFDYETKGKRVVVLLFYDNDPSGNDIVRHIGEELCLDMGKSIFDKFDFTEFLDKQTPEERATIEADERLRAQKRFKESNRMGIRVAVTPEQIAKYNLPELPAKTTDTRYRKGMKQVELDSLRPDILKKTIINAIEKHFDHETFDKTIEEENDEKEEVKKLLGKK